MRKSIISLKNKINIQTPWIVILAWRHDGCETRPESYIQAKPQFFYCAVCLKWSTDIRTVNLMFNSLLSYIWSGRNKYYQSNNAFLLLCIWSGVWWGRWGTCVMGAVWWRVNWFGNELGCRSFRRWFSAVDRGKHCPSAVEARGNWRTKITTKTL